MPSGAQGMAAGRANAGIGGGGRGNENVAAGMRSAASRGSTYGGGMGSAALGNGGLGGFINNMVDRTLKSYTQPTPDYSSLGIMGKIIGQAPAVGPAMALTGILQAMGIRNEPVNRTNQGMPGIPGARMGPTPGGFGSGEPGNRTQSMAGANERGGVQGHGGYNPVAGILQRAFTPVAAGQDQAVSAAAGQSQAMGPAIDTFGLPRPGRTTFNSMRRRFANRGFGNGGLG